jgi:hypothetical protein
MTPYPHNPQVGEVWESGNGKQYALKEKIKTRWFLAVILETGEEATIFFGGAPWRKVA